MKATEQHYRKGVKHAATAERISRDQAMTGKAQVFASLAIAEHLAALVTQHVEVEG